MYYIVPYSLFLSFHISKPQAPQQPPPMDSFLPPDYHPLVKNPKELCMPSTHQLHNLVSNIDRINIHPVLDLSSRQLSVQEQEVLLLGLKFSPTPEKAPDPLEFFDKYHDQCQRVYNKLIRVKSDMPLPRLIEEHLAAIMNKLAYTSDLAKQNNQVKVHAHWQNLSAKHQQALHKLRLDKSLTIKQADKGSCIVVMDTGFY